MIKRSYDRKKGQKRDRDENRKKGKAVASHLILAEKNRNWEGLRKHCQPEGKLKGK